MQKQSPTPLQTEQGRDQECLRSPDVLANGASPSFEIGNIKRVAFGKIRATFDLVVGPITLLECKLIVGNDEAPKFIAPPSVKEHYSQAYRSTVEIDRKFARDVFDAVVEQLAAFHGARLCRPS